MRDDLVPLQAIFATGMIVGLALGAGLLGAYGRERHEGRRPDSSWWITRACIMPFLAIVVSWAIDQWHLNRQQTALLAALLALSGYEAVRIILERVQKRGEAVLDTVVPKATSKPYSSIVDTDQEGRPAAHIVITDHDRPVAGGVGQALRDQYKDVAAEDVPDDFAAQLWRLDRKTGSIDDDEQREV